MGTAKRGAIHPMAVFAVAAVLLAVVVAIVGKPIFEGLAKRQQSRKAEAESSRQLIEDAKALVEGGTVSGGKEFPDTPVGRMNKQVYELMLGEQERQKRLEKGLADAGWDWVMSAESLSSKANVEESLRRLRVARQLVKAYSDDLESDWNVLVANLEREAQNDAAGRRYFEGFKNSANTPGNGLYYARKIMAQLQENHDALEGALNFLRERSGRYTVAQDGSITFDANMSDADVDAYNAHIEKVNSTMEAIEKTEQERMQMAQQRIRDAQNRLR